MAEAVRAAVKALHVSSENHALQNAATAALRSLAAVAEVKVRRGAGRPLFSCCRPALWRAPARHHQ